MVMTVQTQTDVILGLVLVELLNGNLSDQTLALVAAINRDDIQPPLDHLVGFLQNASIAPEDRAWLIKASIKEIEQIAHEEWEKKP
jgi:hypothetical protein